MNLPGRAPKAAPVQWEAMAETLNPRGDSYSHGGLLLPPGEWVAVDQRQSYMLSLLPWATVRERKPEDGS